MKTVHNVPQEEVHNTFGFYAFSVIILVALVGMVGALLYLILGM